jgi:hypothetical protein
MRYILYAGPREDVIDRRHNVLSVGRADTDDLTVAKFEACSNDAECQVAVGDFKAMFGLGHHDLRPGEQEITEGAYETAMSEITTRNSLLSERPLLRIS